VREASLAQLRRLQMPTPPPDFPLVWEPGDEVELRPLPEIEARTAVLNVALARTFGMPPGLAMAWLLDAHLIDHLTEPEWRYVSTGEGDERSFALHRDALFALAWLLGVTRDLDPRWPPPDGLMSRLPDLADNESFAAWQGRTLSAPQSPGLAAVQLDLHFCLDYAYQEAESRGLALPGTIDSNAIAQRRWVLAWAVHFIGPRHGPPLGWEEVDLSTW
jgi:hypothetical protein